MKNSEIKYVLKQLKDINPIYCGSLIFKVHNAIEREIKDIDMIVTEEQLEKIKNHKHCTLLSGTAYGTKQEFDSDYTLLIEKKFLGMNCNCICCVFVKNDEEEYSTINYKGTKIKCATISKIIEAKQHYLKSKNSIFSVRLKHSNDIKFFYKQTLNKWKKL